MDGHAIDTDNNDGADMNMDGDDHNTDGDIGMDGDVDDSHR